jgi:hypothetical protein
MNPLRTLNIYYPALADGVCSTLHPYLEEYTEEDEGQGRVVIYLDDN